MSKAVRWAMVILGFLWMAFVFASFYLVQQQRPLSGENLRAIGSLLGDVAVAGAILFAAASIGHQVCRRLGVLHEGAWETLAWSTAIGLGVVGSGVFALGLAGYRKHLASGLDAALYDNRQVRAHKVPVDPVMSPALLYEGSSYMRETTRRSAVELPGRLSAHLGCDIGASSLLTRLSSA